MGFFDYVSDMYSSLSIQSVEADAGEANAPKGGVDTKSPVSGTDEESPEEAEVNKADAKKGGESDEAGAPAKTGDDDEEAEDEEEEEEEDDDEPVDRMPILEEECKNSAQCAPAKHHFEHCVERVEKQQNETGKAQEDCVEEFFHLAHCATNCAAPKLFKELR